MTRNYDNNLWQVFTHVEKPLIKIVTNTHIKSLYKDCKYRCALQCIILPFLNCYKEKFLYVVWVSVVTVTVVGQKFASVPFSICITAFASSLFLWWICWEHHITKCGTSYNKYIFA